MSRFRPATIVAACLLAILCRNGWCGDAGFPRALVDFVPYRHNPVFRSGSEDDWDARIRERGWILRDNGTYKMWFTGYDGTGSGLKKLGYATSPDGIDWNRHPQNPIYAEHWVEDMMVVKHNGTYYMFAEGRGDRAHWLTSRDGVAWQRRGTLDVRLSGGGPIPPGPYGTPTVFVKDGRWHLFYERRDRGVWLATSRDLQVWTNVSDEPVLSPGPAKYDRLMIALNQIVEYGGRFYAYYHGTGSPEKPRLWCTGIAVSDDLRNWKKFGENPLRPVQENKSSGILVDDGRRLRLYTMHDRVDLHLPAE